MNTEDFEQAVRLAGSNLIALKGVMKHKLAPQEVIFGDVPETCEDLAVELHTLVSPGNFHAIVDNCFDLPNDSEAGEVRATKDGQVWVKSTNAWVYLTHVAGVR